MFLTDAFGAEALGGAVLAAAGYVFKQRYDRFQEERSKPILRLEIVPELAPSEVSGRNCSFGRLSIANLEGREAAEGVLVQIEAASGPAGSEGVAYLPGCSLAWAKADRGKPYVEASTITLPGGGKRQVDLVHLNEAVSKMIVDVRPQPGSRLNRLESGTFRFELALGAENAGTKRYAVEVEFHEGWNGDYGSASEHLALQNLEPLD